MDTLTGSFEPSLRCWFRNKALPRLRQHRMTSRSSATQIVIESTMTRILLILGLLGGSLPAAESPNILWFVVDDMSANFSCY